MLMLALYLSKKYKCRIKVRTRKQLTLYKLFNGSWLKTITKIGDIITFQKSSIVARVLNVAGSPGDSGVSRNS